MKDTDNRVRAVIRNGDKILCFRANPNNAQYDSTTSYLVVISKMMNVRMKPLFEN